MFDSITKEISYQPLYDYRRNLGKISFLRFFDIPVGIKIDALGIFEPRTFEDTNMYMASQLPRGIEFLAHTLRFYTTARNEERDRIMQAGHLEFRLGNKLIFEDSPLAKFPALYDTFPWDALQKDLNAMEIYRIGLDKITQKITPCRIESNQAFEVRITYANPIKISPRTCVGVIIDGYRLHEAY